ncbi:MAG: YciI family protein [Pseudoclavibacter sp.]|jgi:uncharacterized protein YciI
MLYAVQYRYIDDAEKLGEIRPEHRRHNAALHEQGLIVAAGPYSETPGALLLYSAPDRAAVEAALDQDPFWLHGCVAERTINEWTPAVGGVGI